MSTPKDRLKDLKKRLAKERAILRKIKDELESLDESCSRGLESLDESIDALSEYV